MENFQGKEIPHEIVVDILSRLPVKSLIRFRCVCKQWLSLTYEKHFIDMHFEHVKQHSGFIISYGEIGERHYEQNFVILEKDGTPTHKLKFEIDGPWRRIGAHVGYRHRYHVLPSCNGLICFYGRKSIYLCNPGTHEIVSLPHTSANRFSCGFGFDSLAKQYKVFKLIHPIRRCRSRYIGVSQCKVLTVGDESWREIGKPPFEFVCDPVFVEGFLHWRVSSIHEVHELIVSLDVGAEKFGIIPHPECLPLKRRNLLSLLLLGGYLCLLDRDFVDKRIMDLWILEDYTARTWVKERIVHPFEEKLPTFPVAMINGEILLHTMEKRLISYNLQYKSFRKVDMEGQSSVNFTISSHVESLTPILIGAI